MLRPVRFILATLFALTLATISVGAAEQILSFNSRVEVATDGVLQVTETIRVNAEGRKIRRGIYRDFPLTFQDANGRVHRVSFDVISVNRDGKPDDYRTQSASRAIRLYIGNVDVLLDHGEHTYEITYKTDRQIRFFDSHDELYWNVTGNFWDFPIRSARADIILPDGVQATDTNLFTGSIGATDRNATASNNINTVEFTTTQPLGVREGLTIAVKMPKGSIAQPTSEQKLAWFWRDNKPFLSGFFGLLIVTLYYFWAWNRVGRDPDAGPMVPRWDAPDGISPAQVHYIENKGLSGNSALSASLLNLAVKGFVQLEEVGDNVTIKTLPRPAGASLPIGEAAILKQVEAAGGTLGIRKSNSSKVLSLVSKFRKAMYNEHRNKFFVRNLPYVFAGIGLSALTAALTVISSGGGDEIIGPVIIIVFLSVIATIFFATVGFKFAGSQGFSGKLGSIIRWVILGFFAMSFLPVIGSMFTDLTAHPLMLGIITGIVMLNGLFFYLLGAPTPIGRIYMDGIEGLKTYINLAEKDRMNLAGAPVMSPRHFETVLPYAVSLGLEKPWSNAFQAWLATAAGAAAAATYSPNWYAGRSSSAGRIGETMAGLPASISKSMTNAMPAPSSSSSGFSGGGGGGGSSGGGGGGGGGGGW